jgi:Flp pilus assembly protein CpaB
MRRSRTRTILFVALIILILLSIGLFVWKSGILTPETSLSDIPPTPGPTPIPTIQVVVLSQRVVRGEVISADKLTLQDYEEELVLPIMYTQIDQVAGLTARYSMDPYTVVTSALVSDIVDRSQGSDDALFIETGMVAVSIPVSRLSSISYAPTRGDRVNVIITLMFVDLDPEWQSILPNMTGNVIAPGGGIIADQGTTDPAVIETLFAQPFRGASELGRAYEDTLLAESLYLLPSEPQRPRLVSQTLIQNVVVLQLGNFPTPYERALAEISLQPTPTPDPAAQQGQAAATPEPTIPPPPDVITLIVTPQDAVTLNYLIFSGAQLTLVMRNPLDTSVVPTEAVTMSFLLDQYNIPIPVKLPYGFQPAVSELIQPVLQNDTIPATQP